MESGMKLATYYKSPAEVKRYRVDYSSWLDTGETVTARTLTVTPAGELLVDGSSITDAGMSVTYFVSGGDNGQTYNINIQVQTSGGQTKEDDVYFKVRDVT
jgi:hypothetical protein